MRPNLLIACAASALLFSSAALAQSATPAPGQGQGSADASAGAAASSSFTDEQLQAFANVTRELQRTPGATQDQAAMAAAVQRSGLTVEQYNQIANQMRTDQAFNARIQQLARAGQSGASESSTTSPSAPGAPAPSTTSPSTPAPSTPAAPSSNDPDRAPSPEASGGGAASPRGAL